MAIDNAMTALTLLRAQQHVYNVCSTGKTIYLIKAVTKDEMGSRSTESKQSLHAFPIRFTPFSRETASKISWTDNVDVICYVSKYELDQLSLDVKKLRARYSILEVNGKAYPIRYMEYYQAFADDFLYMVIGGKE